MSKSGRRVLKLTRNGNKLRQIVHKRLRLARKIMMVFYSRQRVVHALPEAENEITDTMLDDMIRAACKRFAKG